MSSASAVPDLKAETFSGDIKARVPQSSNGRVAFNTFSGDLKSDLPLTLHSQSKRNIDAISAAEAARSSSSRASAAI